METGSRQSDGSLVSRFGESLFIFVHGPSLDLGPHPTPREMGLRRKVFRHGCLCLPKRACMQYRFTTGHGNTPYPRKEYTTPDCPVILHVALLGLQCYPL
jgi:hypothetical protein